MSPLRDEALKMHKEKQGSLVFILKLKYKIQQI